MLHLNPSRTLPGRLPLAGGLALLILPSLACQPAEKGGNAGAGGSVTTDRTGGSGGSRTGGSGGSSSGTAGSGGNGGATGGTGGGSQQDAAAGSGGAR